MRSVEAIRQELQEVQSQILDLATNSAGCELLESTYYQELAAQRDALQRELLELETGRVFGCSTSLSGRGDAHRKTRWER